MRWLSEQLINQSPPGLRSDADLTPDWAPEMEKLAPFRPAAVLVPVVKRPEPTILLTRRSGALRKHAGQISFPGGAIDAGDADATAAALRETHEEVGIAANQIEVVAPLDTYRTGTGFEVSPFVGLVDSDIAPVPEPGEVDEIFEVPLGFIMDRRNHQRHSGMWRGYRRHYYVLPYSSNDSDYYIWGATAAMLVNLCDVLEPAWTLRREG